MSAQDEGLGRWGRGDRVRQVDIGGREGGVLGVCD